MDQEGNRPSYPREEQSREWKVFKRFAQAHPDMVVILNGQGTIRYLSPSVELLLGYPERRFLNKSALGFLHHDDRARAARALEFAVQNPDIPATINGRLQRSDSEWIECEMRLRNVMNDPLIKGVLVFIRNVSDSASAERRLIDKTFYLETVNELNTISNNCDSFDQFITKGINYLLSRKRLSLAKPAAVFLQDPETRELKLSAAVAGDNLASTPCEIARHEHCVVVKAAKTGKAQLVRESLPPHEVAPDGCPRNRYAVPIAIGGYTMGVLSICSALPTPPTKSVASFLKSVTKTFAELWRRFQRTDENARLSAFPRENPFPILECNGRGEITYLNPAVQTLLWRHTVDLEDLIPEDHSEIMRSASGHSGTARRAERQVGDRIYSWLYHPVPAHRRVHIYGRDITEQIQAEKQLAHDAMHDGLTDLPNRNLLLNRISSAMAMTRRREDYGFAVLRLDLDRFKVVTDSLGHTAGDRVLKKAAERILSCVGAEDTVGRMGGDEYLVLLEDIQDTNSAARTAQTIQDRLSAPMEVGGTRLVLSAGVGVALSDTSYESPEEMLRDADTAMHRAKVLGRGKYVVFDKAMHGKAMAHLKAQSDLRGAIENGGLSVSYQPIFSLEDLRVRGFEALVRWNHPTRGMIHPSEFIAVAEDTGLIIPLGDQVLATVCAQLATWHRQRMPLAWISVNLSAQQFQMQGLVASIVKRIESSGANPRRLLLEITESTAAENPERAVMMLQELKSHGVRIALDDFGTGYSSMAYLKRFPIDAIKLDRSFVKDLPESHDDAAIAESVIAMSQSLGLKVVAEGVENERQAMFLRSKGCDEVQGFLYGRPMSADDASAVLKKGVLN